jgi:hypothetical protein
LGNLTARTQALGLQRLPPRVLARHRQPKLALRMPHDFRDGASAPYTSTLGTLAIAIAMAFTVTSPWLSCAAGASRARRTCFKSWPVQSM